MKRRKPLRADPEKVREFLKRSRENAQLSRSTLKPSTLNRKPKVRPVEGPLSPAEWRQAAFDASGGRCIITGSVARDVEDRRFHAHHPLAKRELRARRLFGCVWDPRNALWLRADVHERHESAASRIPAELLRSATWAFCRELDALEGTRWATDLVLRTHSARGGAGDTTQEGSDGEGQAGSGDGRHAEGD